MVKKRKNYTLNDVGEAVVNISEAVVKLAENATEFQGEMREFQKEVYSRFEGADMRMDALYSEVQMIGNDVKDLKLMVPRITAVEIEVENLRTRVERLEKVERKK